MSLTLVPVTLDEANAFVEKWHRHHKPIPGAKFCIGVANEEDICGVAIVGRPVARMVDDGWTLEVNRTCTDGTKNANSILYGACRRAAWALGYKKLITDRTRHAWEELANAVMATDEWKETADRLGVAHMYKFGDVLA